MNTHALKTGLYNALWGAVGTAGASVVLLAGTAQGAITGGIIGMATKIHSIPGLFSSPQASPPHTASGGREWMSGLRRVVQGTGKTLQQLGRVLHIQADPMTNGLLEGAKIGSVVGTGIAAVSTTSVLVALPLPNTKSVKCSKPAIFSGIALGVLVTGAILSRSSDPSDLLNRTVTALEIGTSVGAVTSGLIAAIRA